jgi:hypothetical protein
MVATGKAIMKLRKIALDVLITVGLLAGSVHAVYLASHAHPYAGVNVGVRVDGPAGRSVGIEWWRDSGTADMYAGPTTEYDR